MTETFFLDTNVLVYAHALGDPRQHAAQQLLFEGGAISPQVLNEFASVARSKLTFSWEEVRQAVEKILILCPNPKPLTVDTHLRSLSLCTKSKLSIWDSLIVAAAIEANCTTLYSEDLLHNQIIDGLQIVNPFAGI